MTQPVSSAPVAYRKCLAALVPCFNAGKRVLPVVERLAGEMDHIIVVDDGSTDGCTDGMRDLPVQVIRFDTNQGKGHALLAGFKAALASPDIEGVCVLDADGQHDPSDMPRFYEAFREEEADLVIGSRVFDQENVPWRSRFGNKLTRTITALLLGRRIPDTQSGYRLHSRRFLEAIVATVPGGRYETEMEILVKAVREGFNISTVPISTIYEQGNKSSHFNNVRDSALIYARLLRTVFRNR